MLPLSLALAVTSKVSAADSGADFAAQLHTEYARQSLLFRIDAEGLHLTRRDLLDLSSRAAASDNGLDDSATASSVTRLAGDISPQRSADLRQSANIQAAIPSAEWLDSDGTIIVVTQFEEPRLARVPQQGQLIHEAVLGQTSAYFLLRGPAKAVKVNVFLPDLAVTQSHDLRGTGAADKNDAEVSTQAFRQAGPQNSQLQDVLQKQNWQIELPQ